MYVLYGIRCGALADDRSTRRIRECIWELARLGLTNSRVSLVHYCE
jgi:hypothetical protein